MLRFELRVTLILFNLSLTSSPSCLAPPCSDCTNRVSIVTLSEVKRSNTYLSTMNNSSPCSASWSLSKLAHFSSIRCRRRSLSCCSKYFACLSFSKPCNFPLSLVSHRDRRALYSLSFSSRLRCCRIRSASSSDMPICAGGRFDDDATNPGGRLYCASGPCEAGPVGGLCWPWPHCLAWGGCCELPQPRPCSTLGEGCEASGRRTSRLWLSSCLDLLRFASAILFCSSRFAARSLKSAISLVISPRDSSGRSSGPKS